MATQTSRALRLATIGLVGALALLGLSAWPGAEPREPSAAEPGSTASPSAATTDTPIPATPVPASPAAARMADRPVMTAADWGLLSANGWGTPIRRGKPRGDLSPCLHNPLTWPAVRSAAARYVDPTDDRAIYQEYVLSFPTPALAHEAVVTAAQSYNRCSREEGLTVDAAHIATQRDRRLHPDVEEMIEVQREAGPYRALRYVLRVARHGPIVVVLENTVESSDRSPLIMRIALQRAAGLPITCSPDCGPGDV